MWLYEAHIYYWGWGVLVETGMSGMASKGVTCVQVDTEADEARMPRDFLTCF